MAIIGRFTKSDDGYVGTIRTLSINAKARFAPAAGGQDKAPDFRVFAGEGEIELGAAWIKKARETGRAYLSVKLDDPSFPQPIHASLVEAEGGFRLIWSR